MPAKIKHLANGKVQVSTPNAVHAKGTTLEKAMAQVKLLNAIDHGFIPDKNRKGKSKAAKRRVNNG